MLEKVNFLSIVRIHVCVGPDDIEEGIPIPQKTIGNVSNSSATTIVFEASTSNNTTTFLLEIII